MTAAAFGAIDIHFGIDYRQSHDACEGSVAAGIGGRHQPGWGMAKETHDAACAAPIGDPVLSKEPS